MYRRIHTSLERAPVRALGTLSLALAALACVGLAFTRGEAEADATTRVFLNGQLTQVSFNDGDTFRALGGEFNGINNRLAGYNTLESYGPVHQWGSWHPYELYIIAKIATYNAQRGTWHCHTDGSLDGYGRTLTDCPDLIVSQVRQGLAHVMQVDDSPAAPEYLRAQQDAIRHRRGIWAHGVPDFIMTSVHSAAEDPSRPVHYNRLISTLDGHSESMEHNDTYEECEWVCDTETRANRQLVEAGARRLREDPRIAPRIADMFNINLITLVDRFVRTGEIPEIIPADLRNDLSARLTRERDQGMYGETYEAPGSCMLYVTFERRYGGRIPRAACLNGHGNWHGQAGGH